MIADNLLPVWSFIPNWREPVIERLGWFSDVDVSESGHPQARALRLVPRRSIEALFTPFDEYRSFLNLCLQRLGTQEWMVPLWFDQAIVTDVSGTTITVDTTDREFVDGTMGILIGDNPFDFETFTISTVSSGSIEIDSPVTGTWPAGSKVYPMRRSWVEGSSFTPNSTRVSSAQIRFNMDVDNSIDGGAETFAFYQGVPILTHDIDWSQSLSNEFEWISEEFDGETGIRHVVDSADRAFVVRRYGMLLCGRSEHMEYRKLLYRLEGRTKPVWLPSFSRDIEVVRPALSGSSIIDIRKVGIGYVGGVTDDVKHLLIGGDEAIELSDIGAPQATDEERLLLSNPLSRDVVAGEYGSFLHQARLEQDVITIEHQTDIDGASYSTLAFRDYTSGRDGSAQGHQPIPISLMDSNPCGVDNEPFIQRLPLVWTTTLPDPMPIYQGYYPVDDAYFIRGKLRLQHSNGINIYTIPFSVGTIQSTIDGIDYPATFNFSRDLNDPEGGTETLTIDLVRSGSLLTITANVTGSKIGILSDWVDNTDPGNFNYIDNYWLNLSVQGQKGSNGWDTDFYVPSTAVELVDPVESGASPDTYSIWHDYFIPFPLGKTFTGFNQYFVPYLTDENP